MGMREKDQWYIKSISNKIQRASPRDVLIYAQELRDKVEKLVSKYPTPFSIFDNTRCDTLDDDELESIQKERLLWKTIVHEAISKNSTEPMLINRACQFINDILAYGNHLTVRIVFGKFPHNLVKIPLWVNFVFLISILTNNSTGEEVCLEYGVDWREGLEESDILKIMAIKDVRIKRMKPGLDILNKK